jgi:site-specific DNA recombinase
MPAPIRAVAYYRMSTDRQEDSVDRQRSQVIPYAARRGYAIVREYIDHGIAGDEERRRKAFLQMLADAPRKDFAVILCDDKDRFGRFDSITYGYYVKPLRDAGVSLETVAQGRIDWNSFAGRVTDAVLQEAKKLESQAMSRRVLTQMLMMAKDAKYLGGPAPHGMRYVPDDVFGKRLVAGDAHALRAVRLIFEMYERGHSLDAIGAELYANAMPSPHGKIRWNKSSVRVVLKCRKYTGDQTWNAGHDGKYTDMVGGQVRTHDHATPRRANALSDWVIVPDVHEAVIDRAQFERCQARLERNRRRTTPAPNGGDWLLSGLLVCGQCGWRMVGCRWHGKRYYRCGCYNVQGKNGCHHNAVQEAGVLRAIVRKLQEVFLSPENLQALRDRMREQVEAVDAARPRELAALRNQVEDLTAKVQQGTARLALIPQDLLTDFAAQLRAWREERDALAARAEALDGQTYRTDMEGLLKDAEEKLYHLRKAVDGAEPCRVRAVVEELVSRVALDFVQVPKARRTFCVCTGGTIYVQTQEGLTLPWQCAESFSEASRCASASPPGWRRT